MVREFLVCHRRTDAPEASGKDVGIDVGLSALITTSQGEKVAHPRFYRNAQRRLRVAQRRVARRKKGGNNRHKAVAMLQGQHDRIANQRKDYLNKLAHTLIGRYDRIALEDLEITRMVHGNLAKSMTQRVPRCLMGLLGSATHAQGCKRRSCGRSRRPAFYLQNLFGMRSDL